AEQFRLPAVVTPGGGPVDATAAATPGLRVDGEGVVLSALRRAGDELELRLVAETPGAPGATVELPSGIAAAREVDLLGRPLGEVPVDADGVVRLAVAPWEIRTVRLLRADR